MSRDAQGGGVLLTGGTVIDILGERRLDVRISGGVIV